MTPKSAVPVGGFGGTKSLIPRSHFFYKGGNNRVAKPFGVERWEREKGPYHPTGKKAALPPRRPAPSSHGKGFIAVISLNNPLVSPEGGIYHSPHKGAQRGTPLSPPHHAVPGPRHPGTPQRHVATAHRQRLTGGTGQTDHRLFLR